MGAPSGLWGLFVEAPRGLLVEAEGAPLVWVEFMLRILLIVTDS